MPRRNEDPEWDTNEEEDSSSGEDSGFEDEEGSDYGSSEGGASASGSESDGDDDDDDASSRFEDETGSEEGDETGSEEDDSETSDSEDDSDDSDDSDSDDYGETTDEDEDIDLEDVAFQDEDREKETSTGSLYNDPSDKPKWARFVPAKIMALGVVAAGVCCFLMIALPLALIIGLSVGLTGGKEVAPAPVTPAPVAVTGSPTGAPVLPGNATLAPIPDAVIRTAKLTAKATNTIYRDGIGTDMSSGEDDTMLVQNGPDGNTELPSAYSLVEFDGIIGIGNNIMSVEAYLAGIEGLTVEFCLNVARNENNSTFSTCLLPPQTTSVPINNLTGTTAPQYTMPGDCVNDKVVTFEVTSSDEKVCVNVAPLLLVTGGVNATESSDDNASLRGRRKLDEIEEAEDNMSYLFMIDTPEESDGPGTKFYSSTDSEGRVPSLSIAGENTCQTIAEIACANPQFTKLCELIQSAGLVEVVDSNVLLAQKTVFAPNDDAFAALSADTLNALTDLAVLKNVLEYHVVPDKIMSTDLKCNLTGVDNAGLVTMANGGGSFTVCDDRGAKYQVGTGVSPGVNSWPEIVVADIETCFGVIHVIDQVLIPADTNSNITCVSNERTEFLADFCSQPNSPYSMFCVMVTQTRLADIFSYGMYTIFVPTNEAISAALDAMGGTTDVMDIGRTTTRVVLQHVVSGSTLEYSEACDSEVVMANGDVNTIICKDGEVYIRGPGNNPDALPLPKIVQPDILGCNVMIHLIDGLIIPAMGDPDSVSEDGDDSGNDGGETGPVFSPCGICGPGFKMTLANATVEIPEGVELLAGSVDVTCEMADSFCRGGACSPNICTAFAEGISSSCGCELSNTVANIVAQNSETSTLVSLATLTANLVESLSTEQDVTVFAPTNEAFDKLKDSNNALFTNLQSDEYGRHLEDLLLHHVLLQRKLLPSDVTDGLEVPAANGEVLKMRTNKNGRIFVNDKRVGNEVVGDNGIVYTTGNVILPSWANQNIPDVIGGKSDLSVVRELIVQADLVDTLAGAGPFTIFVPINSVIEEDLDGLQASGLAELLKYHVVPGIYPASSINDGLGLTTVEGGEILFNVVGETVTVNGNRITQTDILANNGIIHLIDGYMEPNGESQGPTTSPVS